MLLRDIAGLIVMSGTGVTPNVYFPEVPIKTEDSCITRMVVMDKVGSHTIRNVYKSHKIKKRKVPISLVREIGKSALTLIQQVHAHGIIHGDIHWLNFVYSDSGNIGGSMKLIDFGRSKPYVAKSENDMKAVGYDSQNWNEYVLSPGEIEGKPVSRADDLFRLAEMLVLLIEGDDFLRGGGRYEQTKMNHTEVAHFKRNRVFDPETPNEIIGFYQYTLSIGFGDTPQYEGWFP
jgi:serine/threonine protein kinase